jgi:hypothetical protein
VTDVLAGHADVIGDLVRLVALFGARQDARARKTMDRRMVGISCGSMPHSYFLT